MAEDKVRKVLKIAKEPISMETPIGDDEDSNLGDFIEDTVIHSPMENATDESLHFATDDVLSSLTAREAKVLRMRFGIGMNHPELGRWLEDPRVVTERHIAQPSATVLFGDSGPIENKNERDPDQWVLNMSYGGKWLLFRTPSNEPWYTTMQQRIYNRHDGVANTAHVDGHVAAMKSGAIGFQYNLGHPLALWDKK